MRVISRTTVTWLGFTLLSGSAMAAASLQAAMPISVVALPSASIPQAAQALTPRMQATAITPVVTASYSYDSLGRLIQESAGSRTSSFTYDAAGNRTQAAQ